MENAGKVWVELRSRYAHPEHGTHQPGSVIAVPEAEASALVEGGYAVRVSLMEVGEGAQEEPQDAAQKRGAPEAEGQEGPQGPSIGGQAAALPTAEADKARVPGGAKRGRK